MHVEKVSFGTSKRPLRHSRIDWLRRLSCVICGSGAMTPSGGDSGGDNGGDNGGNNGILTVEDGKLSESTWGSQRCVPRQVSLLCRMLMSRDEWTGPAL
jgi:hypothetical protein